MDKQKLAELFKATASFDTPEGVEAYKAFAQALTVPILQEIRDASIMRQLFAVERLANLQFAECKTARGLKMEFEATRLPGYPTEFGYLLCDSGGFGDQILVEDLQYPVGHDSLPVGHQPLRLCMKMRDRR